MHTVAMKIKRSISKEYALVFLFTVLMAVSAYIKIPLFFSPVPLTLQTFVLYVSLACIRNKASLTQFIYLALGAAGLPVFANGACGIWYLLGPTGGYLVGFCVSALLFGNVLGVYFYKRGEARLSLITIFFLCACVIYLFGILWLVTFYGISFKLALLQGVAPFLFAEFLKILAASAISYQILKR